jgi:hypothetical protein
MTRGQFAHKLCNELGIEKTLHVRRAFATWMQSEGGSANCNPLNTTLRMPGSWDYPGNTAGVQEYPDFETGLRATVKTFDTKGQGYEGILESMRHNDPARQIVRIIGETNWGTGKTLMAEVLAWIARVPWVLRQLERKEIAG